MSRASVLVVDDDATIAEVIGRYLHRAGYQVRVARDGVQALASHAQDPVDLIVLDVMLPRLSGLEVLKRLRATSGGDPRVIMVSARGEEADRVNGLAIGADDYVVKPFSPRELVARVDAVLRRSHPANPAVEDQRQLVFGDLQIDVAGRRVVLAGEQARLTQMEFDLLLFFARSPEVAHSRAALMQGVWGYEAYTDMSTVTVHVKRLRDKIQPAGAHQFLQTVHGIGYRFHPPATRERPTDDVGPVHAAPSHSD